MNEPLAIIGMGCRFPGDANSPEALWQMLCAGKDAIREIPADRWSIDAHYDPVPGRVGKSISKWGGFIERIEEFDAGFFGISRREADGMDPQQRLLLEASWRAIEDAGQRKDDLRGSNTGVFVGISTTDYAVLQTDNDGHRAADIYAATGSTFSIAANRISYCFDLLGPSMAIDTACSSALSACHVAAQNIWRGECKMALVAGVNLLLNPATFIVFSRMAMLSPDGRCKAFDASANGFVRAEGVGAILLKPLSAALADKERIYALIRATASNEDGRTPGMTVPSGDAQQRLIRRACESAGVSPGQIAYMEAHGTGTPVGDPIEANALGFALREGRDEACLMGSIKTNIGHLEAAAGAAGLIKAALVLRHGKVPPSLHFNIPNPNIDFDALKLRVARELQPLPKHHGERLAGINSFGFGGANVHVILSAPPTVHRLRSRSAKRATDTALVLPLSARGETALREVARSYIDLLAGAKIDAAAVCAAAAMRRSHFPHRLCVVGASAAELRTQLEFFVAHATCELANAVNERVIYAEAGAAAAPVFVFSGQGPQWWAMGRELLEQEPVFRQTIDACEPLFASLSGWSLLEELSRDEHSSRLHDTSIAQPALFALQVALAALWRSWGVEPAAVVGHSVGEAAAAYVSGALTLPEAARIIFHRGRCMQQAVADGGRMLAAGVNAAEAQTLVVPFNGAVEVAAFNAPNSVTLSGERAALEEVAQKLEARGAFCRFLQVNYAFHSRQMDAIKAGLLLALGDVTCAPEKVLLISTVSGEALPGLALTAEHWWRNVRQPVRFEQAIGVLAARGHSLFLEVGAHPTLTTSITHTLASRSRTGRVFCSLRRQQPERATLLTNLGALHVAGSPIAWGKVFPDASAEVALPEYPWQRERHWRETPTMRAARLNPPTHPFLSFKVDTAAPSWNTWLDLTAQSWLKDHRFQENVIFPGAGYVESALGVGREVFASHRVELQEMEFHKALILPQDKGATRLGTTLNVADGVLSFSSRGAEPNQEWSVNATARIRAHSLQDPIAVDLPRLKKRLLCRIEKDDLYKTFYRMGLNYGPAFKALAGGWSGDGEALGVLHWPDALPKEGERFTIQPAILDACFQAMMLAPRIETNGRTWLPTRIDRLQSFGSLGEAAYCYARVVEVSSFALSGNFQVLDPAGRVLLAVEGFHAQVVRTSAQVHRDGLETGLYEQRWIEKPLPHPVEVTSNTLSGIWLLFADRGGVARRLGSWLKERGAQPVLVFSPGVDQHSLAGDGAMTAASFSQLRQLICDATSAAGVGLAGVVHLWSLDAPDTAPLDVQALQNTELLGCQSIPYLAQALTAEHLNPRLWIVTRGAQSAGGGISVSQAPIVGIGRTLINEYPALACRLVDLYGADVTRGADALWGEITAGDEELEVAWRGATRLVCRVTRKLFGDLPPRKPPLSRPRYRLVASAAGVMDDLVLIETARRRPGPHEVEIEIGAAGLNFRDVMKAIGVYPASDEVDLLLGDECAGRVVAIGAKVRHLSIGDEVIAAAPGCFGSHLTAPALQVVRKPRKLSLADAATFPVAFMTAHYALNELARVRSPDTVLIHAATGGVGLAAVQIARLAGGQIFATAGSDEKRSYLRTLGIRHVMDSRSLCFAADIRRLTQGRGVDVVLNSLAGEAIAQGLSLLAPGGRFLEIGKRDVYANSRVGLRALRNNGALFVIDLGQVMANDPQVTQRLLGEVMHLFRRGALKPLPHQTVPIDQAASAFRTMAQARHIGKLVLSMPDQPVRISQRLPAKPFKCTEHASYLVTGGLGGFGLAIAQWLVQRGARNLVLTGRSGAATAQARAIVARLRRQGVKVLVVKADVAQHPEVTRILTHSAGKMPPIRGIFHAAMVLDDALIAHLTPERLQRVMAPKVSGAWNLHLASAALKLDCFVLFSSAGALTGAPGQASYVAANCFLDALAHHRRAGGLPAVSVNWGAIADVGVLARNPKLTEQLAAQGIDSIAPAEACEALGRLLACDVGQIGVMRMDWQKLFEAGRMSVSPKYSELYAARSSDKDARAESVRQRLSRAPGNERLPLIAVVVADAVARVLRADVTKLDADRPLEELGLDSLMVLEFLHRLELQLEFSVPPSKLTANATINSLAGAIAELIEADLPGAKMQDPDPRRKNSGGKHSSMAVDPPTTSAGQQLLALRPPAAGLPLFLIHTAGGGTGIYDELVQELSPKFAIYGLRSQVLAGAKDEWRSLDELAASYAQLIGMRQPRGPVSLAGFSAGGIFALATAGELERHGRQVKFVALFDTPIEVFDPTQSQTPILAGLIGEIYSHLCVELGLSQGSESESSTELDRDIAHRAASATTESQRLEIILDGLGRRSTLLEQGISAGMRDFFKFAVQHVTLLRGRPPSPVMAPVWLWRTSMSCPTGKPLAPELISRVTANSLSQRIVEGKHFELMQRPRVTTLAAGLAEALNLLIHSIQ